MATRRESASGCFPCIEIEAGALSLFERLNAWKINSRGSGASSEHTLVQAVVDRWRKVVADGDSELFDARLEWDGFDEERVLAALSWSPTDPESRMPPLVKDSGWCEELGAWFHAGLQRLDDRTTRLFGGWAEDLGVAFVELWTPWVVEATDAVSTHPARMSGKVSDEAMHGLSRHVLLQIGELGSESAYSQFNRRRSTEVSALSDRSGNDFYAGWVLEQLDRQLRPLFEEFPVLA
jgi:hypothetical protein